jgi:aerobic carbon-monoxide dehydrogenase medium subunit
VKPAPFDYFRVDRVEEAVTKLAELGPDAKLLAGGQSLVPLMNFRLVRPSALVDITRIRELRYVRPGNDGLRIGALTRHADLESMGAALDDSYRIFAETARLVGHMPIRARGTLGGSLAHSDPSSEWCALATALDATIVAVGATGQREIAAERFFGGFFTNALDPGEMITEVRVARPARYSAVQEFSRRHGDFAIVSVVVALDAEDEVCSNARIVIGGVGATPVRATVAEQTLVGHEFTGSALRGAAQAASREIEPISDLHGTSDYRRSLTEVLVRRALEEATSAPR